MKIDSLQFIVALICFVMVLIAINLIFGVFTLPISNHISETLNYSSSRSNISGSAGTGPLIVSIGNYSGILPVFVDNNSVGEVSKGKPLNISVNEGYHTVRVCDGKNCEQVDVESKTAIKIFIDFGERLPNISKGSLNVSIGTFKDTLPVYLDNTSVGKVSPNIPLNLSVKEGRYTVKVCSGDICESQSVKIESGKQTVVDFGERLEKAVLEGPLIVSIWGYTAELPVFVDNNSVGNVSNLQPLSLKLTEGNHTVKVCVGLLCENETVEIMFAKPVYLDFGDRLKKIMDVSIPTIRIIDTQKNDNKVMVTVEFINPTKKALTMSATIRVAYSYIAPSTRDRVGKSVQGNLTKSVKASNRTVQYLNLTLTGGKSYISEIPTILESSVT
jgi:hypothetical protein